MDPDERMYYEMGFRYEDLILEVAKWKGRAIGGIALSSIIGLAIGIIVAHLVQYNVANHI